MINSVNTLDVIKPKLLNMEKFNATSATRLHHRHASSALQHTHPNRAYLTFVTKSSAAAMEPAKQPTTLVGGIQPQRQERVKVQHLENHTKLQNNNCWNNFRTLYNLSASSTNPVGSSSKGQEDERELDVQVDDDMQQKLQPKIDIQNKSAFNIDLNKRYIYSNSNYINNTNTNLLSAAAIDSSSNNKTNHVYAKHQENVYTANREQQPLMDTTVMILAPATHRRTEDQEHAYRRIESVHNYAKLKAYDDDDEDQSPNGSRHSSSYMDDEDDEEDDEEDEDDDDEEDNTNDAEYYAGEDEMIDLEADYEDILNRRRFSKISRGVCKTVTDGKETIKPHNYAVRPQPPAVHSAQQNEDEIDVETVEHQNAAVSIGIEMNNLGGGVESSVVKPDHHARRPMNAFLIFCKRHRAIVKERYKTLENRAITKILGDWWASLDANDKNCFTNLAQQNKDAFFSANPNFKWYKLPAPPLRTLSTRPTNCGSNGGGGGGVDYDDSNFNNKASGGESISNNTRSSNNYFKLADEAQMGDLSQLMEDKSRNKQCALQQALGETSHFMSTHLTGNGETTESASQPRPLKRHLYNENSFSSNSSEEDGGLVPKKKNARSCKGKIYQELINSGQIAAPAIKKSKSSQRLGGEANMSPCLDMDMRHKLGHNDELSNIKNVVTSGAVGQRRLGCESDNIFSYDFATFDLEEKIKELPALCLDDYLQRKRNTKKKKKFSSNGKKRGGNRNSININCSASSSQSNNAILSTTSQSTYPLTDKVPMLDIRIQQRKQQQQQQQQQAVGSQKRKARKESITRRDVSAIEQEVASLLPLTINGCCYFQEAPLASLSPTVVNNSTYNNDIVQKDNTTTVKYFRQTSPIIPLITTTTSITSPLSLSSPSSLASASTSTASSLSPSSPQQSRATATAMVEMLNGTLNDNISSTSDLLILAEVAANRTELKH